MKNKILMLFLTIALSASYQTFSQEKTANSTASLLEKAKIKAKKEGKKIFVKFEASWCGWCHRMTKNMKAESTKKFFEDNYVLVPLVVMESKTKKHLENAGSKDFLEKYTKGKTTGIPFWLIFDDELKLITDSFNAKGSNIGCPATEDEVKQFIGKLEETASKFRKRDKKNIIKQFVIKK